MWTLMTTPPSGPGFSSSQWLIQPWLGQPILEQQVGTTINVWSCPGKARNTQMG